MIIKNASVFTEDGRFIKKDIFVDGEYFSDSCQNGGCQNAKIIDASSCYAIPGLVDIHLHGCDGVDFCDGTIESIEKILAYEAKNGITTVVPATMTLAEDELMKIMKAAAEYRREQGRDDGSGYDGEYRREATKVGLSYFHGINMEGPFVSAKKCGAQNTKYLRKPDIDMFNRLYEASEECIRFCDIAPEEDTPSMDFIKEVSKKCTVSLAHTDCDYDTAKQAFESGACHLTHLFNAMAPLGHRNPGPIAAAAESDNVIAELICDGVHVAAPMIRTAFKLFGRERIVLISDSMMATGLGDGEYELGRQPVSVRGNEARLSNGTIAGSVTNLMGCLKYAVKQAAISLENAVYSATVTPAKAAGCYDVTGSITPGKYADLVLLDKETLDVKMVIARGVEV
ncbi:N-acetylglucosamine-6-phosphate deacetylase [Butyrivibrio sp. M55]|uniref:N-acetylglucosamine-6-phosphate deacetylase n=1 Tax=Butyrivibrio sp. M55 TaxID=1855323 RepID=UPI0008EE0E90|nr:N-acetylglucosamine-6-phosphate deacetylase [Butyrivibrio sp. M55]SFU69576.1 N-acetylglucosamine-6-phosphate deacetylase [Butyrivibrio sp. M55]